MFAKTHKIEYCRKEIECGRWLFG